MVADVAGECDLPIPVFDEVANAVLAEAYSLLLDIRRRALAAEQLCTGPAIDPPQACDAEAP